ncbi:MAG: Transcriptional regulator, MecI family [Pseudonocardiales bacterium]|nr:Transcriptional regulator, MecI family [Pseudonocardiales bacterium]
MRGFGELEAKIMDRVWSWEQPATVRDVLEDLRTEREIAYTTVMTVMDNLHRKGWLQRELNGRAYHYEPTLSRSEYIASLMRDALTSSADRAATLVRFTEQLTEDESDALRTAMRRLGRRKSGSGGAR